MNNEVDPIRQKQLDKKRENDAFVAKHSGKKGKQKARKRLGFRYTRVDAIRRCVGPERV